MKTILQIPGNDLTESHYAQVNEAELREFGLRLPAKQDIGDRLYFLLIETQGDAVLACGYLKPIHPVIFHQETFSFLNIGGIIANEKGKGYGKRIMAAVREYLTARDKTGLGFCFPNNQGFYEKCGFNVEPGATDRFIYVDGEEKRTADGQYILYLDSSDRFMEKVLADKDHAVFVPDPSIW